MIPKELDVKIRLEGYITEREAMIAENKQREQLEQSMAFSAEDFWKLSRAILSLRE